MSEEMQDDLSDTDSKFQSCLLMLRKAKSDNHKFAALMAVAQLRNEKLSPEHYRQLLDAIEVKFLTRLLRAKSVPEDCPDNLYKSVVLCIMSVLCADPQTAVSMATKKTMETLKEIVLFIPGADEMNMNIVDDCYDILTSLASTPGGIQALVQYEVITSLVEALVENTYSSEKSLSILCTLIVRCGSEVWPKEDRTCQTFEKLMVHYVQLFSQYQDMKKFELCGMLSLFVSSMPYTNENDFLKSSWIKLLVKTINTILTSKLGAEQREPTIMLTASLIQQLGPLSILPPVTTDVKLFLTVTHLACIEVRMILENLSLGEIVQKANTLGSCYQILEDIIGHMTTSSTLLLDDSQTLQLHSALTGAFNAILIFLKEMSAQKSQNPQPVVIATVRVLGAWLAEETSALRKETYEILPFLLKLCSLQVKAFQNRSCEHDSVPNSHRNSVSNSESEKDLSANHCVDNDGVISEMVQSMDICDLNGDTNRTDRSESDRNKVTIIKSNTLTDKQKTEKQEDVLSKKHIAENQSEHMFSHQNNEKQTGKVCMEKENSKKHVVGGKKSVSFLEDSDNKTSTQQQQVSRHSKLESEYDSCSENLENKLDEHLLHENKPEGSHSDKHINEGSATELSIDVWSMGDFVRFLLPGFCHMMAEDEARDIMLSNDALPWLVDYFDHSLKKLLLGRDIDAEKMKGSLAVLCGIFLNLLVMEDDLSALGEILHSLRMTVIQTVPSIPKKEEFTLLWANMVTVGLFLMRNQVMEFTDHEVNSIKFFQSAMSFITAPLTCETQDQSDGQGHGQSDSTNRSQNEVIVITKPFLQLWDDISELWHLSVQVLGESMTMYPEIPQLMTSTGSLQHFIDLLQASARTDQSSIPDPENIHRSIVSLMSHVTESSQEAKDVVMATDSKIISLLKSQPH